MLGLPQSTEVRRPLPKAQLYKRFNWMHSQFDNFETGSLFGNEVRGLDDFELICFLIIR